MSKNSLFVNGGVEEESLVLSSIEDNNETRGAFITELPVKKNYDKHPLASTLNPAKLMVCFQFLIDFRISLPFQTIAIVL